MSEFLELTGDLKESINQLNQVLQGDENATVTINGVEKPSISKLIIDTLNSFVQLVTDAAADIDAVKYETTVAGIAGTIDGQFFSVVSDDDEAYLDLYLNDNGTAVFEKRYPSSVAISAILTDILNTDATYNISEQALNSSAYQKPENDEKIDLYSDKTNTKSLAHFDKRSGHFEFEGVKSFFDLEQYVSATQSDWDINNLPVFENGAQGFWYDPNDTNTLFQDLEMTIPAKSNGDPVAIMLDKSGNGNHLTLHNSTLLIDGSVHSISMVLGYGEIANPEIFSNIASITGSISFEVLSSATVKWLLYVSRSAAAQTGVGVGTYSAASDLRLYGRRLTTDVTQNIAIANDIKTGTAFNTSFNIDYLNAKALVRYNNETVTAQSFLSEGYSAESVPEVAYIGNGVAANSITGNFFGAVVRINKLPTDFHNRVDSYLTKNLLPSEINLFIVFGQSNTDGRVNIADGPALLQDSKVDNVKVWNGQDITNYALNNTGKEGNGSSWVTSQTTNKFSFAHVALKNIAETMDNVVVCQVTSGGTALSPAAYARGSWCPNYNEIPDGTPRLLEDLVTRIGNLMAFCARNNIVINFKAIIAHQGESDSQRRYDDPALYGARWSDVINILRGVAEDPELPVIYGTVPSSSLWYDATIRQAHLDFAANDPNAYCRDNENISMFSDDLHFDAPGSVEFGEWAATTFNNL
ncbi:sialate O-acetylesterase [Pseudoalteromonas prydzensis]|uniref:sialate O-acetylesterase n=1 Tax=Pseudoalteromonas prydzensis TaxID=182141 RepID=UPI0007E4EE06|nr:sialate O-acetylesterase [Pseudoalteromonas prydzensis]MBE0379172.1 hypothetical protein [Pseudoalteromonas prydzensis ACAM 620]